MSTPPADHALTERFRDALVNGEIAVHYQRIVQLPTLRTVKLEALARWNDPERGPIAPDVFIALAEQNGLINALDRHVARQACIDLGRWRGSGWPELAVAINFSPLTLADPSIVSSLLGFIAEAGLPPAAVWVEVTESALVGPAAQATIAALANSGIRVSLDDFGTGYSTLTNLRQLAVHALKIDRSFVSCSDQDPAAVAMIRSIVGLGHELGHAVVAEGVETEMEEQVLRRLGVTLLQGYRYSVPAPFDTALGHRRATATVRARSVAPPVPPDEEQRLAALAACHILDTDPEPTFNTLVRLAATACGTPMAMITFIDRSRQWLKAAVGLPLGEADRSSVFCSHTVAEGQTMVVENATEDERFARNPYVIGEPLVRFYAGAPLVTSSGHAVGTISVLDVRPRRLDDERLDFLGELADQVVALLELRRLTARLETVLDAQQLAEESIRFHATHDHLTGLATRREFHLALADRLVVRPTGVITVDLAGFRGINDRYGEDTGDQLLVHVARSIRNAVRREDLVARIDGDQFAIAVGINADGLPSVSTLAQRVRAAVRQPRTINRNIIIPDASIGLAAPSGDDTAESILRRAEAAMDHERRQRRSPRHADVHPDRPT